MSSIYHRTLNRLQGRFRRARPGSVLIMVVALLVLMALIGTAYISTARIDRYSAQQNTFNTEIDLLVQGVINMVDGVLIQDLYKATGQNAANFRSTGGTYTPYTTTGTVYSPTIPAGITPQPWLGDRIPLTPAAQALPVTNAAATAAAGANPALWAFISAPPTGSTWQFESPYISGNPANYATRQNLQPTYVAVPSGNTSVLFPALYDPVSKFAYLAADADGDGVADAGLYRLPVGEINGVTYYAGVRIVDNAAGVNASVAYRWPYEAQRVPPGTFFPTSIDLNSLVIQTSETPALLNNRVNGPIGSTFTFGSDQKSVDDAMVVHPEIHYYNELTAMYYQLARRLDNPGYVIRSDGATKQCLALPPSEGALMARRFIIRDPSVTASASSNSLLEQLISTSVYGAPAFRSSPYTDTITWYNNNFNFTVPPTPNNMPIRSLLTARNGVSVFAPSKFRAAGAWVKGTTYNFGDWVTTGPAGPAYVCIVPNVNLDPTMAANAYYWAVEPWSNAPTKTSANTATFGQLWAAYWSVMWDQSLSNAAAPGIPVGCENRMFRSSIRREATGNVVPFTPRQQLQLRAALSAVNTIGLRTSGTKWATEFGDVTSRKLTIAADPNVATSKPYDVTIYSGEANPYITEVYANDEASIAGGYVAVELYNPFDAPITLLNWQLGTVAPGPAVAAPNPTPLVVTPLASTVATWAAAATAPVIPAHGYIVVASSAAPPTKFVGADGTGQWPTASLTAKTLFVVPDLANALAGTGSELMLFRPHRAADWALTASIDPLNPYDETGTIAKGAGLLDFVPVDSYDFTGLVEPGTTPGNEWHYVRPNLSNATPTSKAWHFVYPGLYKPALGTSGTMPRQSGTQQGPGDNTGPVLSLSTMGAADATVLAGAAAPYADMPLQIGNVDFGGPLPLHTAPNYFPYGTFARNGDLLQVPYVGAYRISVAGSAGATLQIVQINPITMDAAAADDNDATDDLGENIGRFCPINPSDVANAVDDYANPPANSAPPVSPKWRYHWAMQLFDYLTVQAPHDDYFPDVDPGVDSLGNPRYGLWDATNHKYVTLGAVLPVANANPKVANAQVTNTPAGQTEDTAPVHGLININTAPWKVLASLPLVLTGGAGANADLVDPIKTAQLAQAIVYFRDIDDGSLGGAPKHPHGPFTTLYELNLVPGFRTAMGTLNPNGTSFLNSDGDLSPYAAVLAQRGFAAGSATDNVPNNFEQQNMAVVRISNLITTRSDSFTVYIIVQGFRNVGTAAPKLVVQRRAAFIADRSSVTPGNSNISSLNVPVN